MNKTGDSIRVSIHRMDGTKKRKNMSTAEFDEMAKSSKQWRPAEVFPEKGKARIFILENDGSILPITQERLL
jgi:hypothetical protein